MKELIDQLETDLSVVELDLSARNRIYDALVEWFDATPKSLTSDPEQSARRLADFKTSLRLLADNVQFKISGQDVEASANGSAGSVLTAVKHGTLWFEGNQDVDILLLSASQDS